MLWGAARVRSFENLRVASLPSCSIEAALGERGARRTTNEQINSVVNPTVSQFAGPTVRQLSHGTVEERRHREVHLVALGAHDFVVSTQEDAEPRLAKSKIEPTAAGEQAHDGGSGHAAVADAP